MFDTAVEAAVAYAKAVEAKKEGEAAPKEKKEKGEAATKEKKEKEKEKDASAASSSGKEKDKKTPDSKANGNKDGEASLSAKKADKLTPGSCKACEGMHRPHTCAEKEGVGRGWRSDIKDGKAGTSNGKPGGNGKQPKLLQFKPAGGGVAELDEEDEGEKKEAKGKKKAELVVVVRRRAAHHRLQLRPLGRGSGRVSRRRLARSRQQR